MCCGTALVGWVSVQRAMASFPVQTCGGLTMHLQPGIVKYPGSPFPSPKPPADMPLTPMAVLAPVFGGATPTTVNSSDAEPSMIGNSYSESAVAGYSTTSSLAKVMTWYKSTVPSCGYLLRGYGAGGKIHSPSFYVLDCQGLNLPNAYLAITFQPVKSGGTLIWYFVQVICEPGRPKSTYIPFIAKSVKITYVFSGGQRAWRLDIPARRVVDNFRQTDPVGSLENVVNASQTLSQGCGTGQGGPAYSATMIFISNSGQKRNVTVDPQCNAFRVGSSRLIEDEVGVWPTLQATVYRYCMGHQCKKTPVRS